MKKSYMPYYDILYYRFPCRLEHITPRPPADFTDEKMAELAKTLKEALNKEPQLVIFGPEPLTYAEKVDRERTIPWRFASLGDKDE